MVADELNPSQLRSLMRELANDVFAKMVVADPNRRVYGMTYEFVLDGQHVQDFGLDSMHDGAWFMSALATAHRIDPDGAYLVRAQRFQVPFYVNLLNHSDRLFPDMIPRKGQETFRAPIKGWAPRGWDDGPGIDLVTVMSGDAPQPFSSGVVSHPDGTVVERDADGRFLHAYFTSSHHLLQDLADGLLNVWLTTRDPALAESVRLIDVGRMEHGHRIPVVKVATGLMTGDDQLAQRRDPAFDPARAFRPIWQGVVIKEKTSFGHYSDGLAWELRAEIARSALSGDPMPDGFVLNTAAQALSVVQVARAFHGDCWQPGMTLQSNSIMFEGGKLVRHADQHTFYNSRGIQFAWIAAAVLPEFRKHEQAWNEAIGTLPESQRQALEAFFGFRLTHERVTKELESSIDATIRHWTDVRDEVGYLPRMIKPNRQPFSWSRYMELGAYAYLMKLIAYRLIDLEGADEVHLIREQAPKQPLPHTPLPESVLQIQGLGVRALHLQ
jgi:hypothetical protein